jgi:hypothetical protein
MVAMRKALAITLAYTLFIPVGSATTSDYSPIRSKTTYVTKGIQARTIAKRKVNESTP